jgi:hypothetical protein
METQRIVALTSKRAEIMEGIRLLEGKQSVRGGLAVESLLRRLRMKLEWINKSIELEQQRSAA